MGGFTRFNKIIESGVLALGFTAVLATSVNAKDIQIITKDAVYDEPMTGHSLQMSISADGRYTLFVSDATELPDGGGLYKLYIHDSDTDSVTRVGSLDGVLTSPYLSGGGDFAVVISDQGNEYDILFHDIVNNTQELIYNYQYGGVDDYFDNPVTVSDDGNIVVFGSDDPFIIGEGSETSGFNIFAYDRSADSFSLISRRHDRSHTTEDSFDAQISGDGQHVLFYSSDTAIDMADSQSGLFLRDLTTDTNVAVAYDGFSDDGYYEIIVGSHVTSNGDFVAYMTEKTDPNSGTRIGWNSYVWSSATQSTEQVNESFEQSSEHVTFLNQMPSPANSISISDDGNNILFGTIGSTDISRAKTSETFAFLDARLDLYNRTTATKRMVATNVGQYGLSGFSNIYEGFEQQISRDGSALAFSALTHTPGKTHPNFNIFTGTTSMSSSPPVADAGEDITSQGNQAFPNGIASSDDVTDSASLDYQWEYVGFSSMYDQMGLQNANVANPTIENPAPPFAMKLTVRDADGLFSEPDYLFVELGNIRPYADAGSDQTVIEGVLVSLDGGNSSDLDGDNLTYHWTLYSQPVGSTASLDSTDVQTSFTPDVPGIYYAALTVNDGQDDSAQDLVKITVLDDLIVASDALSTARDSIASMPEADLPWSTGRAKLLTFLDDAIFQIGKNRPRMARSYVNKTIKRTDGCALRGSVDDKDWIKSCEAQAIVYSDLQTAWNILAEY